MTFGSKRPVLASALLPDVAGARVVTAAMLAVFGTLLLTLSAKVQIPFWPVPMTMQTFVVLLIGMVYGARLAGATLVLYLVEGAIGLPVFAGTPERGIGLAYMMGPTGGFLVAFAISAVLVGWLAERGWDRNPWKAAAALAIGHVLILGLGAVWLAAIIGWEKAWTLGVSPFIAATVLKGLLGVAAITGMWKICRDRSI